MHRRTMMAAAAGMLAAAPSAGQAQTKWVMANGYPDANFHTVNIKEFLAEIERETGGKLAVQLHSNASLMPIPQIKRGVQTGQIQIGEFLLGAYGNEDPIFEVDFLPFLAEDWKQGRILSPAIEPVIRAHLEKQGLTALYFVPWPSQGLYTKTEVKTVEELKGARFRAQTPIIARMAELLGATPVTVQAADIPQAFATGIVNAMITSAQTGVDSSAWDYCKYFTNLGFTLTRNVVLVNTRAFRALDEQTRNIILAAAKRAEDRGWAASRASEEVMTAKLKAQGVVTGNAPAELMAGLRAVARKQEEEWLAKAGPEGKAMLDQYRALLKQG
jgi:TRAP-type C4-dicarboxylate transport system substrate-binding protein